MKKILVSLLVSLIAVAPMSAQSSISERNQKMISREMAKKSLEQETEEWVKKEAKKLRKQGWDNIMGGIPIEKQLERSYIKREMLDENGRHAYVIGTGVGSGDSSPEGMNAAKITAKNMAMTDAAQNIQADIKVLIRSELSSGKINNNVANTITEVLMQSEQKIARTLILGNTDVELYRIVKKNKKESNEYSITQSYEYAYVMNAVKQALIPLMGENGSTFEGIINRAMGF